jgi:hypothetical protein
MPRKWALKTVFISNFSKGPKVLGSEVQGFRPEIADRECLRLVSRLKIDHNRPATGSRLCVA